MTPPSDNEEQTLRVPRVGQRFPLPMDQEKDLVDWIRENPILWNSKSMEYKLKQKKNALLKKKTVEIGKEGDLCQGLVEGTPGHVYASSQGQVWICCEGIHGERVVDPHPLCLLL